MEYDASSDAPSNQCFVMEQKEEIVKGSTINRDEACGKVVLLAGLCRVHYIEYLVNLIIENKIDPLHVLNENGLECELRRNLKAIPALQVGVPYINTLKAAVAISLPLKHK